MLSYRDIDCGLRKLGLEETTPVIVHTSLKAFGEIRGGAGSMLGALLANLQRGDDAHLYLQNHDRARRRAGE